MSKLSSTDPFLFIGKSVKDEYGRQIGRIASFMVSPNGHVDGVFVEHGDGEFFRYSSNQFKVDDDGIMLLSTIKMRVKTLCDDIPLIWRKDQALSELSEKKKIPSEMFSSLHKNFEAMLNQLKAEAQATIETIDKQVVRCDQQIKELYSAMVHLEIEREIGRIDEKSYQIAVEMLQGNLKRTSAEKSDLEAIKSKLSNLLLGETSTTITPTETKKEVLPVPPTPPTPALPVPPESPVVVHVKG